jgi:SAM-dependent methyltransferase
MPQNLYDDPDFFKAYAAMREAGTGLNEVLEQPALRSLLPPVEGKRVLDLGCGSGAFCRLMADLGAAHVVGVDLSEKMLALVPAHPRIAWCRCAIEDFQAEPGSFDLVVSSLAFHYIEDLEAVFRRISGLLAEGGRLVFSIEHPIATCAQGLLPGWLRDDAGRKVAWQVDAYAEEGLRCSRWFVDGVRKYHRTLASLLNGLVDAGFRIERVLEPHALEEAERLRPALAEERRRPPFLLVRAAQNGMSSS